MKQFQRTVCPALLLLLIAGCTNIATFDDSATPRPMVRFPAAPEAKSVTVLPFLDRRGGRNFEQSGSGSLYLGLLPLLPFGYVNTPYPESNDDFVSIGRFHFAPVQDLATASALSLKASNLFSRVEEARSPMEAETDYIWQGTVTRTDYSGAMLSYGITYFASPVLWVLGAPEGVSTNRLGVVFALSNRKTGEVVWRYAFEGEESLVHWIYARVGKDVSLFPGLMRRAMNEALVNLHETFSGR